MAIHLDVKFWLDFLIISVNQSVYRLHGLGATIGQLILQKELPIARKRVIITWENLDWLVHH